MVKRCWEWCHLPVEGGRIGRFRDHQGFVFFRRYPNYHFDHYPKSSQILGLQRTTPYPFTFPASEFPKWKYRCSKIPDALQQYPLLISSPALWNARIAPHNSLTKIVKTFSQLWIYQMILWKLFHNSKNLIPEISYDLAWKIFYIYIKNSKLNLYLLFFRMGLLSGTVIE